MGFLSTLGKIGAVAAPIAASFIPGVGPAAGGVLSKVLGGVSAAGGALSALGSVAGGAAKGAAAGRQDDTQNALIRQQLLQGGARDAADDSFRRGAYQGDDTFRRAQFGQQQQNDMLQRPSLFGQQALAGGLLQGLQDMNITRTRPSGNTVPTFTVTGGLRPSAMGPEAREAGGAMARQALMNMLSGGPAPIEMGPQADLGPGYQAPPALNLPQAGLGEKLLGGTALAGGLLGGIGQFLDNRGGQDNSQVSINRYAPQATPGPYVPPNRAQLIPEVASMQGPMVTSGPQVIRPRRTG